MNQTLYCGVDLHSSNGLYVITNPEDRPLFQKRLPNALPEVLAALEPYRGQRKVVAVESTYNWYWLVDGLLDHGYPVVLAHPAQIEQYEGIKRVKASCDEANHDACPARPGEGPRIEPGTVRTLFWSRRSRDGARGRSSRV
jgi:hypothetical protein